ncbi:hypothetical protein ACWIDS_12495 [Dietzia maris]
MSASTLKSRKLIALLGVVLMVAGFGVALRSVQPTEASWTDPVYGESRFGVGNINQGNSFARAVSTYGFIDRLTQDDQIAPVTAFVETPTTAKSEKGPASHSSASWLFPFYLALGATGKSCATLSVRTDSGCANGDAGKIALATANSVSETTSLSLTTAAFLGSDLVSYRYSSPIRATATCSASEGKAGLSWGGPIILGSGSNRVSVPMPAENTQSKPITGPDGQTATLHRVQKAGAGSALSQLRMRVEASGSGILNQWTLDLILAHAECGVDQVTTPTPSAPNQSNWPRTTQTASRMSTAMTEAPTTTTTSGNATATQPTGTAAPSASTPAATTTTSATPSPTTSTPAKTTAAATSTTSTQESSESGTTVPGTSEPASSESSVPTGEATPETTEQTAVAEGPQEPESVRVGREFAIVNRDGVELGTAKVEDIVRTPGCGVELTLSITTSAEAGPDRWTSVAPDDFAEVRAGGSTREATTLNSDCEQAAHSTTTPLSPGRDYEIVIAFHLDDSAQQAMLRPGGTAGWIFDLPPLTTVAVTTSPSAAPTTGESPTTPTGTELTTTDVAEA